MQLLGEADDDHEEQQQHDCRGADGDAHHLELRDDRLASRALVPHAPARCTCDRRRGEPFVRLAFSKIRTVLAPGQYTHQLLEYEQSTFMLRQKPTMLFLRMLFFEEPKVPRNVPLLVTDGSGLSRI